MIVSRRIHKAQYSFHHEDGFIPLYIGLLFFILALAAYGGLLALNNSQAKAQADLIDQIRLKEQDLQPKLLDQVYAMDKRLRNLSAALTEHKSSANIFPLIENDTHPLVKFSSYRYDNKTNQVTLAGEAADFAVLAQQIAFFEGDPSIDKLDFGGVSLADKGVGVKVVNFTVTLFFSSALTQARLSP